jgi:hypothetical protein
VVVVVKRFSEEALSVLSDKELKAEQSLVSMMYSIYQYECRNYVVTLSGYTEIGDERLVSIFTKRAKFAQMVLIGAERALERIDAELQRRGLE